MVHTRAAKRALTTGRVVPESVLDAAMERVPTSVDILSTKVDYKVVFDNTGDVPRIKSIAAGSRLEAQTPRDVNKLVGLLYGRSFAKAAKL